MRRPVFILLIFSFFITLPGCGNKATVEYLSSPAIKKLDLPFSEAVRVNNTLYLSGQIGNVPGQMKLIEGGIEEETRQTLENIKARALLVGLHLNA